MQGKYHHVPEAGTNGTKTMYFVDRFSNRKIRSYLNTETNTHTLLSQSLTFVYRSHWIIFATSFKFKFSVSVLRKRRWPFEGSLRLFQYSRICILISVNKHICQPRNVDQWYLSVCVAFSKSNLENPNIRIFFLFAGKRIWLHSPFLTKAKIAETTF